MAGTNFGAPQGGTVQVQLTQEDGLAILAQCTGAPSSVATTVGMFEKGCLMIRTDASGSTSGIWEMTGTTAAPAWTAVGTSSPGSISIPSSQILIGQIGGVGAAKAVTGAISISTTGATSLNNGVVTNPKMAVASISGKNMIPSMFISNVTNGIDATGGPGVVIVPGVVAGDAILYVLNLTDSSDASTAFEPYAIGADQVQQDNLDLSMKTLFFFILKQSV